MDRRLCLGDQRAWRTLCPAMVSPSLQDVRLSTIFLVELPFMRLFSNSVPVGRARDANLFSTCKVDIKKFNATASLAQSFWLAFAAGSI